MNQPAPGTEVRQLDRKGNLLSTPRRYWTTGKVNSIGQPILRFEPANSLGQTEIPWSLDQLIEA